MHGIDEGELEIAPYGYYASSLLYYTTQPERVLRTLIRRHKDEFVNCPTRSLTAMPKLSYVKEAIPASAFCSHP